MAAGIHSTVVAGARVARQFTLQIKGGDRLKRKLADTARRLGGGGVVNIGVLAKARYPNGLHVAQNAFWQEFGTKNMPARPAMQNAIAEHSAKWPGAMAKIAKANGYDGPRTLALMGMGIKDQIVASITALTSPPLAESTIERKGFDKPLIETGLYQRSIDYEVTNK